MYELLDEVIEIPTPDKDDSNKSWCPRSDSNRHWKDFKSSWFETGIPELWDFERYSSPSSSFTLKGVRATLDD